MTPDCTPLGFDSHLSWQTPMTFDYTLLSSTPISHDRLLWLLTTLSWVLLLSLTTDSYDFWLHSPEFYSYLSRQTPMTFDYTLLSSTPISHNRLLWLLTTLSWVLLLSLTTDSYDFWLHSPEFYSYLSRQTPMTFDYTLLSSTPISHDRLLWLLTTLSWVLLLSLTTDSYDFWLHPPGFYSYLSRQTPMTFDYTLLGSTPILHRTYPGPSDREILRTTSCEAAARLATRKVSDDGLNDNDMLSYSLTTMMCFLTKEWYGFPAYAVNLFIKAYHKITYQKDLKIT